MDYSQGWNQHSQGGRGDSKPKPPPPQIAQKGCKILFSYDGKPLDVYVSGVTGKEEIYLDHQLISEKRTFFLSSDHDIDLGGRPFTMRIKVDNPFTGSITCTLFGPNKEPMEESFNYPERGTLGYYLRSLAGIVLAGFALGSLGSFTLGLITSTM